MQPGDEQWMQMRDRVRRLYEQPVRAYHNWGHVEACLRELAHVREQCADPDAVELAIWFHDCVYDVHRHDNEERSAEVAWQWLSDAGWEQRRVEEVVQLILATKHNAIPDWEDGRVMVDIDLSILGQPPAVFDAYERAIREEYAFVAEEAFRKGRRGILQQFLRRESIYLTEIFRERYEAAAKGNLERSLRMLEG